MLRDLKLAVELVARLDTKWGLDREAGLLEEVEELLAGCEDVGLAEAGEEDFEVEDDVPDDSTLAVLDCVLLYLRVVHSVDWYQAAHYSTEDRLPHRLGLLHCRGERSGGDTEEVLQKSVLEVFQCFKSAKTDPEVFDKGVVVFQVARMAIDVCVRSILVL